jgi:hypothetical protein
MGNKVQPSPHPDPPQDFNQRELPIVEITQPLFRLHHKKYPALHFSWRGDGRFDGADQDYGICYTGLDVYGAFIECFGRTLGNKFVEKAALQKKFLSEIKPKIPLKITDITGKALTQIGADERLSTGDYLISRIWANAIFNHPDKPDGILYRSRHDGDRFCCGLFNSAQDKLSVKFLGTLLEAPNIIQLADILAHYDFGLI